MITRTAPDSSRLASALRFSRFTPSVTVFTVVGPRPISIARDPGQARQQASRVPDAVRDEHTPRAEQSCGCPGRVVQHVVEDDVVSLPVAGEVLRRVVDDAGRSERADQLHVAGAAYPGDLGTHRRGDLNG